MAAHCFALAGPMSGPSRSETDRLSDYARGATVIFPPQRDGDEPVSAADKKSHWLGFMMPSFVDACSRSSDWDMDGTFAGRLAAQHAMAAVWRAKRNVAGLI